MVKEHIVSVPYKIFSAFLWQKKFYEVLTKHFKKFRFIRVRFFIKVHKVTVMPIYEFSCNECGENFEQILPSSDISSVSCNKCNSSDIKKMISSGSFRLGNNSGPLASGPPSGPPCGKSGFS